MEPVGCQSALIPARAIDQDRDGPVRRYFRNRRLEELSSDVRRAFDMATKEFLLFADIDNQRQPFELRQFPRRNLLDPASGVVGQIDRAPVRRRQTFAGSVPPGEQRSNFAEEIEERDYGNAYYLGIISLNVKSQ